MLNAVIGRKKYLLSISNIGRNDILCDILENQSTQYEQSVCIRVYQGLLKSRKMDFVISKLSELGVEALFPLKTERTVPAVHIGNEKMRRWMKIAEEGSKISGSERVMKIYEPRDFHPLLIQLKRKNSEKLFIFSTDSLSPHIKNVLDSIDYSRGMNFHLFFGPEGGFTEDEVLSITRLRGIPVSMGQFVLKSETAAIIGAGFIRLFYEGK
jgi:16S rRNA (uracil1498-N3)-methyltransferase